VSQSNKRDHLLHIPVWVDVVIVVVLVAIGLAWYAEANAAPAPAVVPAAVVKTTPVEVTNSLRALSKLKSFGYSIDTPARAAKAIRHWQKVNGLVVDGIVGTETLGSLGLSADATVPAVRLNPPAPAPEPVAEGSDPMSVEGIIRDVWPDNIEDWAVRIATRESRLTPHVRNSCCWGLFQIHWTAHRAWLTSDFGITSPEQLYDARTNATVALALYNQVGCRPWGC
jgi:soluble lytic murein transglycosylase-like protein